MSHPDRVVVELLVAAPIDTVWKALRDPEQIRHWFGWEYAGLVEGIDMIFVQMMKADDAAHLLYADDHPDRFQLEAVGGHTIVRVIRSAPVTDPGWQGIYEETSEGWLTFLQQMRLFLERRPAVERRTLFLNGRAKTAGTPLPADALGLGSIAAVPIGEPYSTATAAGETLAGTVWYRGAYQVGVTVDGYGGGLVIVSTRPRTEKSPHGGGQICVTTYGMADDAFARLRERWTAWWKDTYEVIEIQP